MASDYVLALAALKRSGYSRDQIEQIRQSGGARGILDEAKKVGWGDTGFRQGSSSTVVVKQGEGETVIHKKAEFVPADPTGLYYEVTDETPSSTPQPQSNSPSSQATSFRPADPTGRYMTLEEFNRINQESKASPQLASQGSNNKATFVRYDNAGMYADIDNVTETQTGIQVQHGQKVYDIGLYRENPSKDYGTWSFRKDSSRRDNGTVLFNMGGLGYSPIEVLPSSGFKTQAKGFVSELSSPFTTLLTRATEENVKLFSGETKPSKQYYKEYVSRPEILFNLPAVGGIAIGSFAPRVPYVGKIAKYALSSSFFGKALGTDLKQPGGIGIAAADLTMSALALSGPKAPKGKKTIGVDPIPKDWFDETGVTTYKQGELVTRNTAVGVDVVGRPVEGYASVGVARSSPVGSVMKTGFVITTGQPEIIPQNYKAPEAVVFEGNALLKVASRSKTGKTNAVITGNDVGKSAFDYEISAKQKVGVPTQQFNEFLKGGVYVEESPTGIGVTRVVNTEQAVLGKSSKISTQGSSKQIDAIMATRGRISGMSFKEAFGTDTATRVAKSRQIDWTGYIEDKIPTLEGSNPQVLMGKSVESFSGSNFMAKRLYIYAGTRSTFVDNFIYIKPVVSSFAGAGFSVRPSVKPTTQINPAPAASDIGGVTGQSTVLLLKPQIKLSKPKTQQPQTKSVSKSVEQSVSSQSAFQSQQSQNILSSSRFDSLAEKVYNPSSGVFGSSRFDSLSKAMSSKSRQSSKLRLKANTLTRSMSGLRSDTLSAQNQRQNIREIESLAVSEYAVEATAEGVALNSRVELKSRTNEINLRDFKPTYPSLQQKYYRSTEKINTSRFPSPNLNFGEGSRYSSGRKPKLRTKYQTSILGRELNLKSPKSFKKLALTGFEIRGYIR